VGVRHAARRDGGSPVTRDADEPSEIESSPTTPRERAEAVRSVTQSGPGARRSPRTMRPRGYVTIFALSFGLTFTGSLIARVVHGSSDSAAAEPASESVEAAPEAVGATPSAETTAAPREDAPASASAPAPAARAVVPEAVLAHLPDARDLVHPAAELRAARAVKASATHPDEPALSELVDGGAAAPGPLRVEYTLDPGLTRRVVDLLDQRRVSLAHVIVMDPTDGRVLSYVSSDPEHFPPSRTYPAASLIKVVTAAAALHHDRPRAEQPCHFLGSPYVLTPARINPPRSGQTVTLERALATSNNQCFAQLAVHALGSAAMTDAILRFGFLQPPAPGHEAGHIEPGTDSYDLGKLGCGLAGTWITPLHAAQLAATLAEGRLVQPRWIARVLDAEGHELALPGQRPARQVMTPGLAAELRGMLVETTESGTARRGFRGRHGESLLGPVRVAGKTGTLNGSDPAGRYEWFAGVAPADDPKVAIAVVVVQQRRWSLHASQIAGEVLADVFCGETGCGPEPRMRTAVSERRAGPMAANPAASTPVVHVGVSERPRDAS